MRKQKSRNTFVSSDTNFIDLGLINLVPTEPSTVEEDEDLVKDKFEEIVKNLDVEVSDEVSPEPKFPIALKVLEPKTWGKRNMVIVRNS